MLRLLAIFWVLPLCAQVPRIAQIEVYGLRKVPESKVLHALGVQTGDPLPKSKGEAEEQIEGIAGVLRARLEAFCCEDNQPILYVGIEERGVPAFEYKPEPEEEVSLPQEVTDAYLDFAAALSRATAEGDLREDLSAGHSMMENLPCRVRQEQFLSFAQIDLDLIRRVLGHAADPDQRSIAAYVIGYAQDKSTVVADLQSALRDPDSTVRANATRALRAIAYYAMRNTDAGLRVQPTWFVEMANSIDLSDRLESTRALLLFTEARDPNTMDNIRDRALPSLLEMAHWRYLPHALPAFLIVGRVAGWSDADLEKAWSGPDREKTLKDIEKSLLKK